MMNDAVCSNPQIPSFGTTTLLTLRVVSPLVFREKVSSIYIVLQLFQNDGTDRNDHDTIARMCFSVHGCRRHRCGFCSKNGYSPLSVGRTKRENSFWKRDLVCPCMKSILFATDTTRH